ncbi:MAG: DUF1772 domain-containing protein [Chitinophagaceae bacterium]|nr:MAG: DUF1772 domain-containing protein [Chitinophagaceae bacterium]
MNVNLVPLFQFAAVLLTGLVAGLFYGYDCSVVKGLGALKDDAYLQSFQSINRIIQNPVFFLSFMGCLLVLPFATWLSFKYASPATFYLLLAATIVYVLAVFGVTIFGNVPLNGQLAKFSISSANESEIASMRKLFENPWNTFHSIRTVAAIMAFSLTIIALLKLKFNS